MRIDRIDLIAHGPFKGVSLDLSTSPRALHLVHGPNEAGKSSALRAIGQFFTGIDERSPDGHALGKNEELRVGMALRLADGSVLELIRRKGRKNTLLDPSGQPAPEGAARLNRALGDLAPGDFRRRFVIDHGDLTQGGREMIRGQGELGRMLFAAGSGLARVGEVQQELERRADALFKARGKNPSINESLARIKELENECKQATLTVATWRQLEQAEARARARREEVNAQLIADEAERAHLIRLRDAVEPAGRRREILARLAELAHVPRLSANFSARRTQAQTLLPQALHTVEKATREIARIEERLGELVVPEGLLVEAATIGRLYQRVETVGKAAQDRPRVEAEEARACADARAAARALGRDPSLIAAALDAPDDGPLAPLRIQAAPRARLEELAARWHDVLDADAKAAAELARGDEQRARLVRERDARVEPRDTAAHRKRLKTVQKEGDLEARHRQLAEQVATVERAMSEAQAALGAVGGSPEDVAARAVPVAEQVERFRETFAGLDRDAEELAQAIDDLAAEDRRASAELDRLRLEGDVPSEEDLANARALRDASWSEIRQTGLTDARASTHESAVRAADLLADRLRREASRIADRARLLAERGRVAAEVADREARRERVALRRRELDLQWIALWEPIGLAAPGDPRAMLDWLRRHEALAARVAETTECRAELRATRERIERHRLDLTRALGELEPSAVVDPAASLAELEERFDETLGDAEQVAKERQRLAREIDKLDATRPGLELEAAAARGRREEWETHWAAALGPLGLAGTASIAEARAVIDTGGELFRALDVARARRGELDQIDRAAESFTSDVKAVAARVAPDLLPSAAAWDASGVVETLHRRLEAARRDAATRASLQDQHEHFLVERSSALEAVESQRLTLDTLRREAGGGDIDDEGLANVEKLDQDRRSAEAELERVDRELRKLAAGPMEPFLDEVARTDPDILAPRIADFDLRVASRQEERRRADQDVGAASRDRQRWEGGPDDAAFAAQRRDELEARVRAEAEEYALLRLARAVLRQGIERYRKKTQGPVLERARAIFSALTVGSFTDLDIDVLSHDEPVLMGIRPNGERLEVEAMSTGTADQLYLALRLATIHDALDTHEPLPLIVDDALIQFDDRRAGAALETLAELASRTQVVLLTHHPHLVSLARQRLAPESLAVVELPARGG